MPRWRGSIWSIPFFVLSGARGLTIFHLCAMRITTLLAPTVQPRCWQNTTILMPAIVEGRIGEGRIVVWGGGMGFDRSNLARTPRFVPLLHETLRYLSGDREIETNYLVGDAISASDAVERVMGPEGSDSVVGDARIFHAPGVYQWGTQIASVNVADRESDLARITPAEFEIRLCDTPVLFQRDGKPSADLSIVYEYGRWILGFLLALLLIEHFYAAYLSARGVRT